MHEWTILEEKILAEHLGYYDVIKTIWFRLHTDYNNKHIHTDGRINLYIDELNNFIPYANVDLDTKVTWIKNHAGDFYENLNIDKINQME